MILWLVAIVVFILDRFTKHLILASFMPGESRIVIPHAVVDLRAEHPTRVRIVRSSPMLLIVLALAVLALFAFAFRDAHDERALRGVAERKREQGQDR